MQRCSILDLLLRVSFTKNIGLQNALDVRVLRVRDWRSAWWADLFAGWFRAVPRPYGYAKHGKGQVEVQAHARVHVPRRGDFTNQSEVLLSTGDHGYYA